MTEYASAFLSEQFLTDGTTRFFDTVISAVSEDQFELRYLQSDGTETLTGSYQIQQTARSWRIEFDQPPQQSKTLVVRRKTPAQRRTRFDNQTLLDLPELDIELTLLLHLIEETQARLEARNARLDQTVS